MRPQCRSVIGSVWRDRTWRGSGAWPRSSCTTLQDRHRTGGEGGGDGGEVVGVAGRWAWLPGQAPDQRQVVLPSGHKVAAVGGEAQTGDILVVTAEHGQQRTCRHLDQSQCLESVEGVGPRGGGARKEFSPPTGRGRRPRQRSGRGRRVRRSGR